MTDSLNKLAAAGTYEVDVHFKGDSPGRIRAVLVNHGWATTNVDVRYDDPALDPTPVLQPDGQNVSTFEIPPGDHLVALTVGMGAQAPGRRANEVITLRLETAGGLKSPVFGGGSGEAQVREYPLRAPEGHHIVGFRCTFDASGIGFLMSLGAHTAPIEPPKRPIVAQAGDIWVSPVLNVSDLPVSLRWFEALGWTLVNTMNAGGLIADAADADDAGPATFATLRAGPGQLFLYKDGQGHRGPQPAPGSGDDVGATWQVWRLNTRAEVEAMHARAVAASVPVLAAPADMPWGEYEVRIAHPDGHVFRVSAPSES